MEIVMKIRPHCYPPSQDGCDGEPLVFSLLSLNLDKMHSDAFNLDIMLSEMFNLDKMHSDAFNLDKSEMFNVQSRQDAE